MVRADILRDFEIDFKRIVGKYTSYYSEPERDMGLVGNYLSLLLNEYIFSDSDIKDLCFSVELNLITIKRKFNSDDYYSFYNDIMEIIDYTILELEKREEFEVCANLFNFRDTFLTKNYMENNDK